MSIGIGRKILKIMKTLKPETYFRSNLFGINNVTLCFIVDGLNQTVVVKNLLYVSIFLEKSIIIFYRIKKTYRYAPNLRILLFFYEVV